MFYGRRRRIPLGFVGTESLAPIFTFTSQHSGLPRSQLGSDNGFEDSFSNSGPKTAHSNPNELLTFVMASNRLLSFK